MSIGLTVVTSNVGGLKNLINHRENGFLCDKNDTQSFITTILKLLRDSKYNRRIGQNGYNHIKNKHSPENVKKHFNKIINSI